MNNSEEHRIDEYLLGNMGLTEKNKFEEELASDAGLKTAFDERRELLSILDALGDIQMRERVRRVHEKEMQKRGKVKRVFPVGKYALAAAIIALLGVSIWFFTQPSQSLNEQLFVENYAPYSLSFGNRNSDANQQLISAGELYNNKEYGKAIPVFENLLNEDIENKDAVRLAIGIGYLELKNPEKAGIYFEQLASNINSPYYEQGLWYMAMSSLQKNDIEKVRKLLVPLAEDEDSYYYEQAKNIFSNLD